MNRLWTTRLICTLLALAGLVTIACRETPRAEAQELSAKPAVPALKPRPAGLASAEYAAVRKRYQALRDRIVRSSADKEACVAMAQLFMAEARVTGDHPYYYPAAEQMLDRALKVDASFLPALISKGSVLLSLHRFAEALQVGEQARRAAPNTAVVYGILCDANVELGRYDSAVAATDMMVSIRPDLRSYSRISYLREIHGDDSGAISAMILAVKAGLPGGEETEWARYTLGNLYLNQGRISEAEREYMTAIAERPEYPFAIGGLARVRIAQGRTAEAMKLLDTATALMPEFSFVELKADLCRAAGDAHRADSLVSVVEAMLHQDEAAGHNVDKEYALLWADHGMKTADAVERARRELERRPENIEAEHAMALALLRAGRTEEAESYMEKALRMKTNNAVMLAHAGMIDAALGHRSQARAALTRALTINPYLPPLTRSETTRTLGAL
jgi:tetratricopeptide (TPR) repeat protein